jgi:hypothetical protein
VGLAALSVLLAASGAGARDFTKSTRAGKPVQVWGYASWDNACKGGPSPVEVTAAPSHGRISFGNGVVTINDSLSSNRCIGQRILSRLVIYTPAAGFHGTDAFSLLITFAGGKSLADNFTINVQ